MLAVFFMQYKWELLFSQYCQNSNNNECAPTESIKMSLNVPQDVPQDVPQGVPQMSPNNTF